MRTLLCSLLLLSGMATAAQKVKSREAQLPPYKFAVNFNPLALINRDNTLMFGMERRMQSRWAVAADAGVVVHSSYLQEEHEVSGFMLRPMLRYYYGHNQRSYLQLQTQYRKTRYQLHDWLGKDCIAGVPSYERLQDFTWQKQEAGAGLVAGITQRFSKKWLLDLSAGMGALYRIQRLEGTAPNDCFRPRTNAFTPSREDGWLLNLYLAVRITYVIR